MVFQGSVYLPSALRPTTPAFVIRSHPYSAMPSTFLFLSCLVFLVVSSLVPSCLCELIISDNAGDGVLLPLSGGVTGDLINLHGTMKSTSPYVLTVFIHDDGQHTEQFYFNSDDFGANAELANATYTAYNSPTVLCSATDCTGSSTSPVSGNGTYVYTFLIQPQSSVFVNLTYHNLGPNPLPVYDIVQLTIYNPFGGGFTIGDPQFVGLRGQSYQVHGIDGAVYNIISEEQFQVNSRFVFLTEGECPVMDGITQDNCWSHPGSYIGEMSFQAIVDGELHQARLVSGSAAAGYTSVELDNQVLTVGDKVEYGNFSVALFNSHSVIVTSDHFILLLTNSDKFINQALRTRLPVNELHSHGLLGQTHCSKTYATSVRYIEGEVDDYVILDGDMFGTDFVYNQFSPSTQTN